MSGLIQINVQQRKASIDTIDCHCGDHKVKMRNIDDIEILVFACY